MKIAIPVETEESLNSVRAEDFGHAPYFVIAEFEGDQLVGGGLYDNVSHDEFGCAGIAEYVAHAFEADVVIVKQISHDAFAWLFNNGVAVHQELEETTVVGALKRYLANQTTPVTEEPCAAEGHHHHSHGSECNNERDCSCAS